MRFWDMDSYEVMLSNQNAHKSPITCMDSDEYFIYSGDKDNIIKSWQFKELTKDQESALEESKKANSKDKDISDLEQQFGKYRAEMSSLMVGHTAQVNSICAMNDEY